MVWRLDRLGRSLPELVRLVGDLDRNGIGFESLADSRPEDVLLVEDVDRLSRLTGIEWEKLKGIIRQRAVRVVAVNVPTTWQHLSPKPNEFEIAASIFI